MFNQPSHPVLLINATILRPEFRWVSCSDFCPNVRAVQMSCSFLVHFSFSFYHSCQADDHHVLSRSLARHFYGQNLARVSLRIFVRERSGNYNLRSSSDGLLLATPSYRSRVTLGDRSFQVAAPALWNVLPHEIRSITDLGIFKRHLKMHLFREAFYWFINF